MTAIATTLQLARTAARTLSASTGAQRDAALAAVAEAISAAREAILAANALDIADARDASLAPALLDRLALDSARFDGMIRAIHDVVALPDPLGGETAVSTRSNGLRVFRRRIPLGVIGVIYEARPNVTVEAATLAIKSGNAMVLRGGREAQRTNATLADAVREGLSRAKLPMDSVQFIADTDRQRVVELLGAAGDVDLLIPRGGAELMKLVDAHARVPVIRHGRGVCHVFLDASADPTMATEIAFNAKAHRPGVCNAAETLLVHQALLGDTRFVGVAGRLVGGGVELRTDEAAGRALDGAHLAHVRAEATDWDSEYLALVMAVRVVSSLDEALEHIAAHGTHHTATIVTHDEVNARRFMREVDAACVLWNASTRFNDGNELGLGAEIGISTSKMHAYGPMGLRELTAEKFVVYGDGQVRTP